MSGAARTFIRPTMVLLPTPFNDDLPELDATRLRSLEIDIELRDIWERLDQRRDVWDDLQLAVTARAMRVAYDRGLRNGEIHRWRFGGRR
jgi:hypothetical protein